MSSKKRLLSEDLGTFWLTFCGCGATVLAAVQPEGGIGTLGVALAFGLALLSVEYAFGSLTGAHVNPAVTLANAVSGRLGWRWVAPLAAVACRIRSQELMV